MHTYIFRHAPTHMHTHIHTYIHTFIHTYRHTHTYIALCVRTCIGTAAYTHASCRSHVRTISLVPCSCRDAAPSRVGAHGRAVSTQSTQRHRPSVHSLGVLTGYSRLPSTGVQRRRRPSRRTTRTSRRRTRSSSRRWRRSRRRTRGSSHSAAAVSAPSTLCKPSTRSTPLIVLAVPSVSTRSTHRECTYSHSACGRLSVLPVSIRRAPMRVL
jgi:hypothetical protein